jgi:hypothetical protein
VALCLAEDFKSCPVEGFFIQGGDRKTAPMAEVSKTLQLLCGGYFLHMAWAYVGLSRTKYGPHSGYIEMV